MVNFASGQKSQTELRLYFGVEPFLKLLAQFYTRGLLDMGVGVHQHICRSVSCGALNGLYIAAGDHQLIGGTGMPQTVKDNAGELRMCIPPFQELLAAVPDELLHRGDVFRVEQVGQEPQPMGGLWSFLVIPNREPVADDVATNFLLNCTKNMR